MFIYMTSLLGNSCKARTARYRSFIKDSIAMTKDLKTLAEAHSFKKGANPNPADFVFEKPFVG
ncbi:MAG: hypothetical protein JKY25_08550 [Robiginitomaculum sp.]|nr:hypothetical protein [Robiginitomaculum sp.]